MAADPEAAGAGGLTLAAVLPYVPGCEAGTLPRAVAPLAGGGVNRTFGVETVAGRFAVRLHPTPRPGESGEPGIDRAREAVLHAAAARAGVAPEIVHADPAGRFLVTAFVDGRPWRAADLGQAAPLQRLAALLGTLHRIPPPAVAPFRLLATLRGYADAIVAREPAERTGLEVLLQEAQSRCEACGIGSRPAVIVHTDLHHSNLVGATRPLLLDWEYAGLADPLLDPACLLAYYPAAGAHAALLLEHSGLAGAVSVAQLREAAWLYELVSLLWYRVRRLPTSPDLAERVREGVQRERQGGVRMSTSAD